MKGLPRLRQAWQRMQNNRGLKKLCFWNRRAISSSQQQATDDADTLELSGIIHSIHNCPFTTFEDCLIDNNYKGLSATATDLQLEQAWLQIYSEYTAKTDDGRSGSKLRQLAQVTALSSKISRIKSLCEQAYDTNEAVYLDCLRDSGYKIETIADVKKVVATIKTEEMRLSMLVKNLPKEEKGQTITRDYFDDILSAIGQHLSIVLVKENITVATFCAYVRRLNKWIEAQKPKGGKHG